MAGSQRRAWQFGVEAAASVCTRGIFAAEREKAAGIGSGSLVFVVRVPVRWWKAAERGAVRGDGCFVFGELELDDGD